MESTKITNEDFVRAYVVASKAGRTNAELGAELNLSTKRIYQRATYLKKVGVRLPKLASTVHPLDVESLNKLVDELNG